MLAAPYRLSGEEEFGRVEKEGKLYQSKSFGLRFFDRGDTQYSRFGVVVSNKISKEATQRNRIKRAFREAIRQSMGYINRGLDVVFLAKKISLSESTDELMHEVKNALSATGIMK